MTDARARDPALASALPWLAERWRSIGRAAANHLVRPGRLSEREIPYSIGFDPTPAVTLALGSLRREELKQLAGRQGAADTFDKLASAGHSRQKCCL
jgi:hypothetical protein